MYLSIQMSILCQIMLQMKRIHLSRFFFLLPILAFLSVNSSNGDGTYFLSEYMVPRRSTSFCLYDTRSLSSDPLENTQMVRRWMTKGVRHGELVIR